MQGSTVKKFVIRRYYLPYAKHMFHDQGRHREQEVMAIAHGDLKALSAFLGMKIPGTAELMFHQSPVDMTWSHY